jgi:sigma-B regulation protein RsbU (phosphoserine phosphatase)
LRRVVEPQELVEMSPEAMRLQVGDRLDALGFAALAPLHQGDTSVGVLALGPPAGRSSFSRRERRALTRIAVRAAGALQTARAYEDAVARERLARDLEMARGIQRRLLPDRAPVRLGAAFDAVTHACEAVGGDFYDFIDFPDGRVGFAVGDVSGKGIGASLLMASVHSTLHTEATEGRSPGAVLRKVNLALLERKEQSRFVCLFYAVADTEGRKVTYANAGVEPPILVRRDGSVELLTEGGLVLGVTPDAAYPEATVTLEPGDRLLAFSDGLLENEVPADLAAADAPDEGDGLLPGYRRLIGSARDGAGGPREAIRRLLRSSGFGPGTSPPDDVTLLLVQRWG